MSKVKKTRKPVHISESATKAIAQRLANGEAAFIEAIMEQFGKSREEAVKILNVFRANKVVKQAVGTGQIQLVHGAYWDAQVMDNALNEF